VDIQLDSSYFIGEPQDRQYVRKMNPELESGLREQMTQKQEAFEELIGKVGQEKNLHTKAEEATLIQ